MTRTELKELVLKLIDGHLKGSQAFDYSIRDIHIEEDKNGQPCKIVLDFHTTFNMPPYPTV